MHAQGNGDVRSLTKGGMLRCIMALTEVVHAVAIQHSTDKGISSTRIE